MTPNGGGKTIGGPFTLSFGNQESKRFLMDGLDNVKELNP